MEFTVKINCDNDAFQPLAYHEVSRILRVISDRLEASDEIMGSVNDSNGNSVAYFLFT
jgi:hypothetical protein